MSQCLNADCLFQNPSGTTNFCQSGKVDYDTECKLGDRCGWRKGGEWLNYSNLTFNKQAPVGHLPLGGSFEFCGGVVFVSSLASRAVSCNL
ncbi:MAG: hypothetical protein EAZ09_13190 [Oscillatoriales cyanobacterium]|nr:MAG: hypothetical protein EAZ18_12000 [Oscillatoriales cyanobacterium]TAH21053.1 MAG: hypothetical protein EAZ09_13190 [Oscillatoriales cyanobacterium]